MFHGSKWDEHFPIIGIIHQYHRILSTCLWYSNLKEHRLSFHPTKVDGGRVSWINEEGLVHMEIKKHFKSLQYQILFVN